MDFLCQLTLPRPLLKKNLGQELSQQLLVLRVGPAISRQKPYRVGFQGGVRRADFGIPANTAIRVSLSSRLTFFLSRRNSRLLGERDYRIVDGPIIEQRQ